VTEEISVERQERIDKYLASQLSLSRSSIQKLIVSGRVMHNNSTVVDKSRAVKPGDRVTVELPGKSLNSRIVPEDKPLSILYEDEYLLAVDKPSGIIVHPVRHAEAGADLVAETLVNRLLFHYPELEKVGGRERAGLVHRLDRGTSGVLLVARTAEALQRLQQQFKNRKVSKEYRAISAGSMSDQRVRVEVPLARDPVNRLLWQPDAEGKRAVTIFEKGGENSSRVALNCSPITGRTHQIRIHASYIDLPIIGDDKYGGPDAERLMLHARSIEFKHPFSDKKIKVESNLPEVFKQLWSKIV